MSAMWIWLIVGVAFCAAELMAPGVFLLWIGLAAITVGIAAAFTTLSFEWSLLLFGALALVYALVGRVVYGGLSVDTDTALNQRSESLVGREFTLIAPIVNGEGSAKVLDSVWRVRGPEAPAGARVKVVGVEPGGTVLRVQPA